MYLRYLCYSLRGKVIAPEARRISPPSQLRAQQASGDDMRRLVKRNPPSAISHPPAITTVVVNSRDMAKARGKNFGPPMTLANIRHNGVRAVIARCEACGHASDVNVDAFAEKITVPEVGRRLRCSRCGGKQINTRPAWHTANDAWGKRGQDIENGPGR